MTSDLGRTELEGSTVLILGGAGLVGIAVARLLLEHRPRRIVVGSLRQDEAEEAEEGLRAMPEAEGVEIDPTWGNIFVPHEVKDRSREEILNDQEARTLLVNDTFGDLTKEVLHRSALGALLLEVRPDVVVDSVNTAGAIAYQNSFASSMHLRDLAGEGKVDLAEVDRHLATLYLPQLTRHIQILLNGMSEVGTRMYMKIGTAGTGGMGMNVPFTHSEERPSRMLLAKSSLAGAQTLLLYLMARTPGAPAVKEIKPTAAISWKSLGYGPIMCGGKEIQRADAIEALPLDEAFEEEAARGYRLLGEPLTGVYLDSGENGYFSPDEFETITALGLMEFVTPEEIAANVIAELTARPTGKDVVAALDGANMGPTYRAGVLRSAALDWMKEAEEENQVRSVAYEMLGPPRLTKLIFEAEILRRLFGDLASATAMDPEETSERAEALIGTDDDFRQRMLSVGIPVLMRDGGALLRGPEVKVPPIPGIPLDDDRVVARGWVDLRPDNWAAWKERVTSFVSQLQTRPGVELGSQSDVDYGDRKGDIRPGRLGAWIMRYEDEGERFKF